MTDRGSLQKSADAYRTISEVAADLKLPQHVLRFWETRFAQVKPLKRAGGRRFYRPEDVDLLRAVKTLLYGDGYTIKGVQRILREQGPRAVAALAAAPPQGERRQARPPLAGIETLTAPREPEPAMSETVLDLSPAVRSGRTLEDPMSGDAATRLQAVLADLGECKRVLAAARSAAG